MMLSIYRKKIVPVIKGSSLYAQGVFINDKGGIISVGNAEAICKELSRYSVLDNDNNRVPIENVRLVDKEHYLVYLQTKMNNTNPIVVGNFTEISKNAEIYSVFYSNTFNWETDCGYVIELTSDLKLSYAKNMFVKMNSWPGYIGSPIVDSLGNCIAITILNLRPRQSMLCATITHLKHMLDTVTV